MGDRSGGSTPARELSPDEDEHSSQDGFDELYQDYAKHKKAPRRSRSSTQSSKTLPNCPIASASAMYSKHPKNRAAIEMAGKDLGRGNLAMSRCS